MPDFSDMEMVAMFQREREEQERRWSAHQAEHEKLIADLARVEQRLNSGADRFDRHEREINELKPRPKKWWEMTLAAAGVIGGIWIAAELFAQRPTSADVRAEITRSIAESGRDSREMRSDLQRLHEEQAGMRSAVEGMREDIHELRGDLKSLVRRAR